MNLSDVFAPVAAAVGDVVESIVEDRVAERSSGPPDVVAVTEPPADWPGRCVPVCDAGEWLFITILTAPDVSRFPVPAEFLKDQQEVDLSGWESYGLADIRALVTPALPDHQLAELERLEREDRTRPRAGVLKAIGQERDRRGDGLAEWVAEKSGSLLTSRIAAAAVARGYGDPVGVVASDEAAEAELLVWLLDHIRSGADVAWYRRRRDLIRLRTLRLFDSPPNVPAPFERAWSIGCGSGADAADVAAAMGVPSDSPLSPVEVFDALAAGKRESLEVAAEEQLECERRVILASERV